MKNCIQFFITKLCLFSFLFFLGCNKFEIKMEAPEKEEPASPFFAQHRPSNPIVLSVLSFVEHQNKEFDFVPLYLKTIGKPHWNKALVFGSASDVGFAGRTTATSSDSSIVYIPFVRDTQNFVNAALIVKIKQNDTTFRMLYDWQYPSFDFEQDQSDSWNAHNVLHIFMLMDNAVFGSNRFIIKDTRLYSTEMKQKLLSAGVSEDSVEIYSEVNFAQNSSINSRNLYSFTVCQDISDCAKWARPKELKPFRMMGESSIQSAEPLECVEYTHRTQCTTYWFDMGGGGGGGTGNDPGTGNPGGGGGGNGWTDPGPNQPDDCTPEQNAAIGKGEDPCNPGPGWETIDNGDLEITNDIAAALNLLLYQRQWLLDNPLHARFISNFLHSTKYNALSYDDLKSIATNHLDKLMNDADFKELVETYAASASSMHPWMFALMKELALEVGWKVIKKIIPGYGDWQSVKDAMEDAKNGDWLDMAGEIFNIVKKRVPWTAFFDAIVDTWNNLDIAEDVYKVFNKLSRLPTQAFEGILKTIQNKCGGLLEKIEHSSSTGQGVIKYNPADAENFFREMATRMNISVQTGTNGALYFTFGDLKFTYYPVSSAQSGNKPTFQISSTVSNWTYKFRFE